MSNKPPSIPDNIVIDWKEIENEKGYEGPPIVVTITLDKIMEEAEDAMKCVMIVPEGKKKCETSGQSSTISKSSSRSRRE